MTLKGIGRSSYPGLLFILGLAVAAAPVPAKADDVADFYRGKQIRLVIATEAGGGYDLYSRLVTRHMTKHIPGNPTFLPQNMLGASGRTGANWLYNLAPRDGTAIGSFNQTASMDQARKQAGVQFDVAEFFWIGNPIVDNNVTTVWAATGLVSLDDVKSKGGLICAGTSASSPSITFPQIINNLVGTQIRIIAGYAGTGSINLAVERGEANCNGGNTWSTTKAIVGSWLRDHKLNILVQWGVQKVPEISAYQGRDVPLIREFAKSDLDRKALDMINAGSTIGRPLAAPPGVPRERIEALRHAFDETMKDQEFLAEAAKQNLDINPISGVRLQEIASGVVKAPAEALQRVEELMTPRDVKELKKD